ncbi:MAG: ribbon-helix-helix protein, CopG family [Deltaproteobacteria bacterium]|nr:ribbon-helix-helix protein, CopG family [Deltaproteobacteria bacterium]
MSMSKTQVYLPKDELAALHRLARKKKRRMADMVREAVRTVWLNPPPAGPVALADGELSATSAEHDAAFDEP